MSETEKNERIAELEAKSANLLAEVRRLEKAGAELERIAAARLDELVDLRARVLELEASFDLRWKADMRAIERWQAATGRELMWPDHADLCVWLMERIAELEPLAEVGRLVSLLRPGNRLCHASKGGAWYVHVIGGEPEADESTPIGALRAAGIGEEVSRDAK